MNMHVYVFQICSRSVQLFGIFPVFLNAWPLTPPTAPWGSMGKFVLAYVHSLMTLYTCAKFGPDLSSGLEAFYHIYELMTP